VTAKDTAPTLEQVRAYLLAHGWQHRPGGRYEDAYWHPTYGDYPDSGISFRFKDDDPNPAKTWGLIEGLATHEGRCEHEVLADMLGQPDPATLLKRIEELEALIAGGVFRM
jgi:hypothetical protein